MCIQFACLLKLLTKVPGVGLFSGCVRKINLTTMNYTCNTEHSLSALNTVMRCSEISSSTEDSSFRSPSIIQGVCGKFLEYLLYLPVSKTSMLSLIHLTLWTRALSSTVSQHNPPNLTGVLER